MAHVEQGSATARGKSVDGNQGLLVVREDTVIKGIRELRNCRQIEIYGYVEGDLAAGKVLVHKSGKCYGTIKTDNAEIHGTMQGNVVVKNLINIHSSGVVSGNVQYGKLAMELGASLTAEVRNVPPTVGGDLDLSVGRGGSVPVTLQDLSALDPDDTAQSLTFTVSKASNGFVMLSSAPKRAVTKFTQADLEAGAVNFVHDGSRAGTAGFDIVVADHTGATSGAPRSVKVSIRG